MTRRLDRPSRLFSSSNDTKLPVGIFIDLDNVHPRDVAYTRSNLKAWYGPLRKFAKTVGHIHTVKAFANQPTLTHQNAHQVDHQVEEQEWIMQASHDDDDWGMPMVQTGRDDKGILRCGVCGAKMKLTKKDRAKGWDEQDKLDKHMRMLHDREQAKRKTRLKHTKSKKKQKKLLEGKLGEQSKKYVAAQVGLNRGHQAGLSKKKSTKNVKKRNDLFAILKEFGIHCNSVDDVDKRLISEAQDWVKKQGNNKKQNSLNTNERQHRGVLVVVSRDSDFAALLKQSQRNLLTVSVTPNEPTQTKALRSVSDLVLVKNPDESTNVLLAKPVTVAGENVLGNVRANVFTSSVAESTIDGSANMFGTFDPLLDGDLIDETDDKYP